MVKRDLPPEPTGVYQQRAVVICGDISRHRKFFGNSASIAAGLTIVRCPEDSGNLLSVLLQLNASVLVARQGFVEQLPQAMVIQITNFGTGCRVLAILETETLETPSAAKLLRLGCRGVLPRGFSSKLFRRAVLAVLKGELWAPRWLVSDLLSELLVAASLKNERGLTPQEVRVLELSLQGYTNSAIADKLFISLETVRWHKRRLNRKLRGRGQLRHAQAKASPQIQQAVAG